MKTLELISIVVLLSLASCRSREVSFGRSKTSETVKEKIRLNESRSESVNGVRVVDIRDSSKHFVGLRIYPLDTFSLSVDDGFRGRASVIEYWEMKERLTSGKDSSGVVAEKEYDKEYVGEMEIKKHNDAKSREVRKESIGVMMWLVIVGAGVFVVAIICARWKRSLNRSL